MNIQSNTIKVNLQTLNFITITKYDVTYNKFDNTITISLNNLYLNGQGL